MKDKGKRILLNMLANIDGTSRKATCGAVYVVETGRCLSTRLMKHSEYVRAFPSGRPALHIRDCECTPLFHYTIALQRRKEITIDNFCNRSIGNQTCISSPSLFCRVTYTCSCKSKKGDISTIPPMLTPAMLTNTCLSPALVLFHFCFLLIPM